MKVQFDWNSGDDTKNYSKHGVSCLEAESILQDAYRLDFQGPTLSKKENRYITLGMSNRPRVLLIAWTLRRDKVRIISARPSSRKERSLYEKKKRNI